MKKGENYKNLIAQIRGIVLIWVFSFPFVLVLYGNFPDVSIRILALAVVASILIIIIFPYYRKKKVETVQAPETYSTDMIAIKYTRKFLIKLDKFIWFFMHKMSGTILVVFGNMLAVIAVGRISELLDKIIVSGMVFSWLILWFFRWYMKKYHPDYYQ